MCEPISTTTLALLSLGSTAVTAAGALQVGNAKKRAGEAQARLNEAQAKRELEIAEFNATRDKEEGALLLGKQIALAAAQGGDPGAGSNLLVQRQTAGRTQLNVDLARVTGRDKATTLRASGDAARAEGIAAQTSGRFQALGTVVKDAKTQDFKSLSKVFS